MDLIRICDTDLRQITEKQFLNMCSETKQFYRRHNKLFPLNFRKKEDFVSRGKLRFSFFAAGCQFLLHNVAIFLQTASPYESRERFHDTSMHK